MQVSYYQKNVLKVSKVIVVIRQKNVPCQCFTNISDILIALITAALMCVLHFTGVDVCRVVSVLQRFLTP